MVDYYLDGEEKFGPLLSILYFIGVKILPMNGIYDFAAGDIRKSGAKTVLDVGTGPGDVPIRLAKIGNIDVFGIDPSAEMIKIASWRARGLENARFAVGSSRHVPFRERRFDIIFASVSYHHWQRKVESLDYLSKFLNRDGEIRIYEFNVGKLHGVARGARAHALRMDKFRETVGKTRLRISSIREKGQFIMVSLKRK